VLISLVAGLAALANGFWWSTFDPDTPTLLVVVNLVVQVVVALVSVVGFASYKGPKTTWSYNGAGYRVWTFRRAFTAIVTLGSFCLIVLPAARLLGH
jgi:hypothetical protein